MMGVAAYNRGSRAITQGIERDYGIHRDSVKPKRRDVSWGEKAQQRANDRAVNILASNRKLGRNIDVDTLAGCVVDRERVGHATAYRAAVKAFAEHGESK